MPGLVSWWRGETTAFAGEGTARFTGAASAESGKVGDGYRFLGLSGDALVISDNRPYAVQDFSIGAWIRRSELNRSSQAGVPDGAIFAWGANGYTFTLNAFGAPFLGKVGVDSSLGGEPIRDLEWHHVGMTKQGNSVRFFLDGRPAGSTTVNHQYFFDGPVAIGALGTPFGGETYSFLGQIDEVVFFNRPLSDAELQNVAEGTAQLACNLVIPNFVEIPSGIDVGGFAELGLEVRNLRSGTASNLVAEIPSGPGFQLSRGSSSTGSFMVTSNSLQWTVGSLVSDGVASGRVRVRSTGTGEAITVRAQVVEGGVTNASLYQSVAQIPVFGPSAERPSGLISWWRLEEDGRDEVTGLVADPIGTIQFGPGKVGHSSRFDGSGPVLQVGSRSGFRTQSPTVEAWIRRTTPVKATPTQVAGAIFSGGAGNWGVGMHDDGRLYFSIQANSAVASTEMITDTEWHHVVIGRSDSIVRFFIDGRFVNAVAFFEPANFDTSFAIGGLGTPFGGERFGFMGQVDELSVYGRMLSEAEVANLYRAGRFGKSIPELVLDSSAPSAVPAGSQFEVGLSIRNHARVAAGAVVVSNRIPEGVQWIGGSVDRGSLVSTNDHVVWTLPEVAGDRVTTAFLRFQAPPTGRLIVNTATLSAGAGDGSSANNSTSVRILAEGSCGPTPSGLVAWVSGDNGPIERISGLPLVAGLEVGDVPGRVGRAFSFSGRVGTGVALPTLDGLRLQDFTAEAWLRRSSIATVSQVNPIQPGTIIAADDRGPNFSITDRGALSLGRTWEDSVSTGPGLLVDTAWHHVAVTKAGTDVVFYVDGLEVGRTNFVGTFTYDSAWAIGGTFPNQRNPFYGELDEVALYNRALGSAEIVQIYSLGGGGRCPEDVALEFVQQPAGLVPSGEAFTYGVRVSNLGGTPVGGVRVTNRFDGLVLVGATNQAGLSVSAQSPGVLVWDIGTLGGRSNVLLTLTLRAETTATNRVSASVVHGGPDLSSANNTVEAEVVSMPLTVSVVTPPAATSEAAPAVAVAIRLTPPASGPVSVGFATVDGTAVAGQDYVATNGVVEFRAGETEQWVTIPLVDDSVVEGTQGFRLVLTNAVGARIDTGGAELSIEDNEAPPQISLAGGRMVEGNSGRAALRFEVSLSWPSEMPVSVRFSTTNDTARAGSDFLATNGVATVPPGRFSTAFEVEVVGDRTVEANEAFLVGISSPTNGVLRAGTAVGVVVNDDALAGQVAGFRWSGTPAERIPAGSPVPATLTAVDAAGATVEDFSAAVTVGAYLPGFRPSTLVVSEVLWGGSDAAEFQNVSTNVLDVSGWRISFYDAVRWPAPRATVTLAGGTLVPARGVFSLVEGAGNQPYPNLRIGTVLAWRDGAPTPFEPMAVLVQDAFGRVVDFVGFDAAEPSQIAMPTAVPSASWNGPVVRTGTVGVAARRRGDSDRDSAADWTVGTVADLGRSNGELTMPFLDANPIAVAPGLLLDFTNGVWSGTFTLDRPAGRFALYADDGNGNVAASAPLTAEVRDDLAVGLVAEQPQVTFGSPLRFRLSVTNSGPSTVSNVVVATALDRFVNTPARIQFPVPLPGVAFTGTSISGFVMRWTVGNLPAGTAREMVFVQNVSTPNAATLPPTLIAHEARVQSSSPDANPANDVARVEFEASATCAAAGSLAASWWTADDPRDVATSHFAVPSGAVARLVGATAGPGRVDRGWVFGGAAGGVVVDPAPGLDLGDDSGGAVLEGWIRVEPTGRTSHIPVVGRLGAADGWQLAVVDGRPALWTLRGGSVTGFLTPVQTAVAVADGQWHHLAVQRLPSSDGGRTWIVVDGTMVAEGPLPSFVPLGSDAPLVFGSDPEGRVLRGTLDEWALLRGIASPMSIYQAGANGKCLFRLAVVPSAPLQPASFGLSYPLTLVVTNLGPGTAPAVRFAVDVTDVSALSVTATPGTQAQEPGPRMAFTGTVGDLAPRGMASLSTTFTPTNPVVATVVVADAFTDSRRGSADSRTLVVPIKPDSDGDGMDDVWEIRFGLDRFLGADGLFDADGDGMSNRDEFLAATDPTRAASAVRLSIEPASGAGVRVRFPVGPNRNWQLLRSPRLGAEAVWSLVANGATGDAESVQEVEVVDGSTGFLRFVVSRP